MRQRQWHLQYQLYDSRCEHRMTQFVVIDACQNNIQTPQKRGLMVTNHLRNKR